MTFTATLKTCAALAFTLFAYSSALAQDGAQSTDSDNKRPNELWLDTGFATYHFQSDKNLNGRNPGIGLEYKFSDTMALTAGRFYNSDREHSRYAGMYYQPWTFGGVKVGAVVGGFDGYPKMRDGGWFLAIIPAATFEYKRVGVNIAVVPTYKERLHGGISVQLKFKLWE